MAVRRLLLVVRSATGMTLRHAAALAGGVLVTTFIVATTVFSKKTLRRQLDGVFCAPMKPCPDPRPIMPRRIGRVIAIPQVGGLHHRYERLAA